MKKVCLISQQGSGTNLLRAFLNSHSDIYFADELFVSRTDKTGEFQKSDLSVTEFLDDFYSFYSQHNLKSIGFDLKYNQIDSEILVYLKNKNISVIHLLRDTGRTFLKNITEKGQVFSYENIDSYSKRVKENIVMYRNILKSSDYLELTYEDMTRGKEIKELPLDFEQRLLKWLNVDYRKLEIDKKVVTKDLIKEF